MAALAADLLAQWEIRREQMGKFIDAPGKAMIVGGTREICANLYTQVVELFPDCHSDDLDKGLINAGQLQSCDSVHGGPPDCVSRCVGFR